MSIATLIADAVGIRRSDVTSNSTRDHEFPDVSDAPPDTRRLIRDRRYCRVLANPNGMPLDRRSLDCAWKAMEHEMAFVPAGDVRLFCDTAITSGAGFEVANYPGNATPVDSLYLDRSCVTNADFARFVQADGYDNPNHWPEEVLPNVLQFVDRSGHTAPQYWTNGTPPPDKLDHPVVGISWYEANAYATWAGKRLPSTEEWQRAGTWSKGHSGDELRYPWGSAFDPSKANLWAAGKGETVAAGEFAAGDTPNGVRQLVGNVWEWIDSQFYPTADAGLSVLMDQTMAEIRGGAFDTYFHAQATCQFRTGQPLLFRGSNVGFRCCISTNQLPPPPNSDNPDLDEVAS